MWLLGLLVCAAPEGRPGEIGKVVLSWLPENESIDVCLATASTSGTHTVRFTITPLRKAGPTNYVAVAVLAGESADGIRLRGRDLMQMDADLDDLRCVVSSSSPAAADGSERRTVSVDLWRKLDDVVIARERIRCAGVAPTREPWSRILPWLRGRPGTTRPSTRTEP